YYPLITNNLIFFKFYYKIKKIGDDMKKLFILLFALTLTLTYSYSILEIQNEIFLKQKGTSSQIALNQSSWGIKVYPNDIIVTQKNSSCKIGNDEQYIEVKNNSQLDIDKDKLVLHKGCLFIEYFPTLIIYNGQKLDASNGVCDAGRNGLKVEAGYVLLNGKKVISDIEIGKTKKEEQEEIEEEEIIVKNIPEETPKNKEIVTVQAKEEPVVQKENIDGINKQAMEIAKNGNFKEGIDILKKGLIENPKNTSILNNLGVLYHQLGAYSEAMEYYKKALIIDPENQLLYYNIVCLYSKQKDETNTLLWYSRGKDIFTKTYYKEALTDPDLEYLRKITNDLKK
ncbi:tetratricopeptide repeat protein, partial [bacterium]|nr:tetratricopeptide repeat protein [bacterium]